HPEAVDMVTIGPEQGIVDEKRGDLTAAEIVDRRAPIGVQTLARVLMFIQSGAVEPDQAMRVGGEMGRDPVDQYAQSGAMSAFHKAGKSFRIAEAGGGSVKPCGLIAPAGIER